MFDWLLGLIGLFCQVVMPKSLIKISRRLHENARNVRSSASSTPNRSWHLEDVEAVYPVVELFYNFFESFALVQIQLELLGVCMTVSWPKLPDN